MGDAANHRSFICDKCGRVVSTKEPIISHWLIARRADGKKKLVVRCPLHISDWALRQSGQQRTIKRRRQINEFARSYHPPAPNIHLDPYGWDTGISLTKQDDALVREASRTKNKRSEGKRRKW